MKKIASTHDPKVSIVILNWNGKKDTIPCIESLYRITYSNHDIIIADNGSTDGSCEEIHEKFLDITLIKNKENLGFTGGNNIGINYALKHGADYVLLLNNDTLVEPNFLSELVNVAELKKAGIVGPRIYYYSLPYILWSAGGSFIPLIGKARTRGINQVDSPKYNVLKKVFWLTGCAILVKKEVFEKIGVLEELYFSNYEDLDFCYKARKAGYSIWYVPSSVIYHKVAQDWGGLDNPLYIYYQIRNNLLFIKRNIPQPYALFSYLFLLFVSIGRRSGKLFFKRETKKVKYIYFALYDFFNNNYGKTNLPFIKYPKRQILNIGMNTRFIQTEISGIGKYVLNLMKKIPYFGKNQYYFYEYNNAAILKPVEMENVHYIVPDMYAKSRIARIGWEQIYFSQRLKKDKIDIFHGPSFMLSIFKSCKSIITVHDLTFLHFPQGFNFSTKLYYYFFFRRSLNIADMIIADSYSTKKDLIEHYHIHPNKIQVIYLGVDDIFKRVTNKKIIQEVKQKYSLPDTYVLFVGLLSPRKNIRRVLRAFAQLNTNHKFVIVGNKGWLYEPIFKLINDLNLKEKVIFTGYADAEDLPAIYSGAEALVFPSFYEGFGIPILEAMACGCPVITSNISSMPEVAGDAAIFVDPYSINEIKDAMITIILDKNKKQELIKKGYSQVKKFSWQKMAEETVNIYEKLANK